MPAIQSGDKVIVNVGDDIPLTLKDRVAIVVTYPVENIDDPRNNPRAHLRFDGDASSAVSPVSVPSRWLQLFSEWDPEQAEFEDILEGHSEPWEHRSFKVQRRSPSDMPWLYGYTGEGFQWTSDRDDAISFPDLTAILEFARATVELTDEDVSQWIPIEIMIVRKEREFPTLPLKDWPQGEPLKGYATGIGWW